MDNLKTKELHIIDVTPRNTGRTSQYHTIYKNHIYCNLKDLIKGEVNCYVLDDTLFVDIYAVNSTVFRTTINNLSSKIVQGLDSQTVAQIVFKRYKEYIKNLYFL